VFLRLVILDSEFSHNYPRPEHSVLCEDMEKKIVLTTFSEKKLEIKILKNVQQYHLQINK